MAIAEAAREKMLIAGEWVESADRRTFDVDTPAKRGRVIAQVPRATAADVDRAVRAAHDAFPAWRAMAPRERGRVLSRIADAAKQGAQVMCLQELFYGPYFCQVQDAKHYSYT